MGIIGPFQNRLGFVKNENFTFAKLPHLLKLVTVI